MAFPTTGVLDSFGGTLDGWSSLDGTGSVGTISSGQWASGSPYLWAYWDAGTFGADEEAYITISSMNASVNNNGRVFARPQQVGTANPDGYAVSANALADTVEILVVTNNADTLLGSAISQTITAGDSIGIEVVGTSITAYYKVGAGAWASIGTRTDSTYSSSGYIGAGADHYTSVRLDDFGGGTVVAAITKAGVGIVGRL